MNPLVLFGIILLTAVFTWLATLWTAHVTRTGANPLPRVPSLPRITLFKRQPPDDDDDEDEDEQPQRKTTGP